MNQLQIAILEIGKQEVPKGSNWGHDVEKYLKSVGINFPASWCMAFVYWCVNRYFDDNGHINPLVKTGGVMNQWNHVDYNYKSQEPQVGAIFIQDHGHGLGHCGFIESIDADGTLNTIEGNTNDTGSREGYEVCRRKRTINSCIGFIVIPNYFNT